MKHIRRLFEAIEQSARNRAERIAAVLLVAIAIVLFTSAPASAVGLDSQPDSAGGVVFEIPAIPFGIVAIIAFLSPLAIAVVNQEFWPPRYKKLVSLLTSALLTGVALIIYYSATKDPLPAWPIVLLLAVAVSQLSYNYVLKKPADRIETLTTAV